MQTNRFYELIEHTADIGIRVGGRNLKELYRNAAAAMFDIIAQKINSAGSRKEKVNITLKANNTEELLVKWLNELLSLSATKGLIFTGFRINKLKENSLEASVFGGKVKNFRIKTEIKAATYHELRITKAKEGQRAEVIFDV